MYAKGLRVTASSSSGKSNSKGQKSRHLSQKDLDNLTRRQRQKLLNAQCTAYLEHPYAHKLEKQKSKLNEILSTIFDLADNDLLVCDFDTGLNDYSKNLKFADHLDEISKCLVALSQNCNEKANDIRARIDQAKEDKRLIQDIVYLQEIVKESEKCDDIRLVRPDQSYVPKPYIPTSQFRVKRERPVTLYADSTDSENENSAPLPSGDADTKFRYAKNNDFDEIRHPNSICILCDKVLRDQTELRNHMSNHHNELF